MIGDGGHSQGYVYYNEIDPYCVQWLRNLIDEGLIPQGEVDPRDIRDVRGADLRGFDSCHFFAGIGGWPYALRLAGWPDDRPVWTGSCPCQPFSSAGKGQASSDERHLWPAWFDLIRSCKPPVIFGEQVEAAIGWGWLDLVYSDLEKEGYSVGAAVLPACSVGAPHIRQRLWFVADAGHGIRCAEQRKQQQERGAGIGQSSANHHGELADSIGAGYGGFDRPQGAGLRNAIERCGPNGELADAEYSRHRGERNGKAGRREPVGNGLMGNASASGLSPRERQKLSSQVKQQEGRAVKQPCRSFWSDLIWLPCTDGKQRPTQSGVFPLAHGVPARVAKLRAAGNAIVPQVAVEFIKASTHV